MLHKSEFGNYWVNEDLPVLVGVIHWCIICLNDGESTIISAFQTLLPEPQNTL